MSIGESSPERREEELHRGERGGDDADHETRGAVMFAVNRKQRHDHPESDEVDEDSEKDDEDRRASFHESTRRDAGAMGEHGLSDMIRVYVWPIVSQVTVRLQFIVM